jgi:hypothetical protein
MKKFPHLRRRLEKAEGGGNAGGDANDAESVAEAGRWLRRKAAQRADTAQRGRQVRHLVNLQQEKKPLVRRCNGSTAGLGYLEDLIESLMCGL